VQTATATAYTVTRIALADVVAGTNDRTVFKADDLADLAASIRERGLAQPITVRPVGPCRYELVCGERRTRACRLLGWETIPAIVREMDDETAAALMLAENVARADLDPLDEARAYRARIDAYGLTVAELAREAGVSEVRVQFRLKLLTLRDDLQAVVRTGQLTLGYAQIVADSGLDANRQASAVRQLQANPAPTPAWFRRVCGALLEEQARGEMADIFAAVPLAEAVEPAAPVELPTPTTGRAPRGTLRQMAAYWRGVAAQHDARGKNFLRDQCVAAANALEAAAEAMAA
jgi:ParB family chromosome partitioning protein